jgi:hypothetical protein
MGRERKFFQETVHIALNTKALSTRYRFMMSGYGIVMVTEVTALSGLRKLFILIWSITKTKAWSWKKAKGRRRPGIWKAGCSLSTFGQQSQVHLECKFRVQAK